MLLNEATKEGAANSGRFLTCVRHEWIGAQENLTGFSRPFEVDFLVHQELTLSQLLFNLSMVYQTKDI